MDFAEKKKLAVVHFYVVYLQWPHGIEHTDEATRLGKGPEVGEEAAASRGDAS